MLIVLVMMSLKSFSQSATDSTTIRLTKPIAKLVIKDLIKSDGLETELIATQSILKITNKKLNTQMDLNVNLESQIKNLNKILDTKNEQSQQWRELNKELQKDIRKQKLRTKLTGGAGILLVIGAAVLIN
jgi:hypothetical protein